MNIDRLLKTSLFRRAFVFGAGLLLATSAPAAEEAAPVGQEWLELGRQLWEDHAPEELKAQYEFPTQESVQRFLAELEQALAEGSFAALAAYEVDARRALMALRSFQGGDVFADWLEPRLDFLTAANIVTPPAATHGAVPDKKPLSRPYWDQIVVRHQPPARAAALVPQLKAIFDDEGVPSAWVWIAEVESSMNPRARSPAGAAGLFQFMPATAERFGLSTSLVDERDDPAKSARAAAQYLRFLYGRFGSWSLALAAYNAGEGRVGRTLKQSGTTTFVEVAPHLPAETRLYVPKVMATVAAREAIDPEQLPPPTVLAVMENKSARTE